MPLSPPASVVLTVFPRHDDHQGKRFELSPGELFAAFRTPLDDGLLHARHLAKQDLPLFALASFEDDYVEGAGVEHVYALGFDVDEAPVPTGDTLRALGVGGFYFPSSSSTPDAPRWRLFLWLSRPVTGAEYAALWRHVAGGLPFPVGQAAKDPSRGWYVPREPQAGAFDLVEIPGTVLDADALLAIAPAVPYVATYVVDDEDDGDTIGVRPVDISTDEGKARVARAVKYLAKEAKPAISGQGGSTVTFGVAQRLMRGLELPIDVAHTLFEEHYNPRCDPPWSEEEIERKLLHARDKVRGPTGLPSEGFLENLGAPPAIKVARKPIAHIHSERRKVRRADHAYTYVGNEPTASDAQKRESNDLIHILTSAEEWRGVWQFDEFKQALRAVEPPMKLDAETSGLSEEDVVLVTGWFRANRILATKESVKDAIKTSAKMCRYHPVREYLHGLADVPREAALAYLESLPARILGNGETHARIWFTRWLVAAVRRILYPGIKSDAMLVLYGSQGAKKSTLFKVLAGGEDFFKDELDEMTGRDAAHALEGVWILEVAELKGLLKSGHNAAKAFLSRSTDKYRQFGNGEKVEHRRQVSIVGTTNDREFLGDPTGSRRYQPIGLPEGWVIPVEWVAEHRDAIWACALSLALDESFRHWTTLEEDRVLEAAKEEFREEVPWEEKLADHCAGLAHVGTSSELYTDVIAKGDDQALAKINRTILAQVTAAMIKLGCEYGPVRLPGKGVCKRWRTPDSLRLATPSAHEQARRALAAVAANVKTN